MSKFVILPCLDSEQMAASRRRELDLSRCAAASLGRSALEAIRKACYLTSAGQEVSWSDAVQAAGAAKRSIYPDATLPSNMLSLCCILAAGRFTRSVNPRDSKAFRLNPRVRKSAET